MAEKFETKIRVNEGGATYKIKPQPQGITNPDHVDWEQEIRNTGTLPSDVDLARVQKTLKRRRYHRAKRLELLEYARSYAAAVRRLARLRA